MNKILKWTFIILVAIVLIGASFFTYGMKKAGERLARTYDIVPATLTISRDSASIERGEHLVGTLCTGCHGNDLAGKTLFEDPMLATLNTPNLTPGEGGVGKHYKDPDWVRALRHGLDPTGRALFVMPSKNYFHICSEDLSAMIAYLQQVDPVDNDPGPMVYQPLGKFLVDMGAFGDVLNAEGIDHMGPIPSAPDWNLSEEHGDYLVRISGCRTCHGPGLNGGKDANPDAPPGPNLTRAGSIGKWSREEFIKTLRTGITPDERSVSAEFMPWQEIGRFSDTELGAIYDHLRTLDAPDAKL